MSMTDFRKIDSQALLLAAPIESAEAHALADGPGGCGGDGYPLFVELSPAELEQGSYSPGSFAVLEFILPGKPGRWRAAGEVTMTVAAPRPDAPLGIGVALLGLTLTGDAAEPVAEASTEEPAAEPAAAFDSSGLEIEVEGVSGMLADLMGRVVAGKPSEALSTKLDDHDIVASFRDDEGVVMFLIAFDKAGAARVGGALTMLPSEDLDEQINAAAPLEGEPLENAGEVLNIMSALFHDAGAPHVVLAETVRGEELASAAGGELLALLEAPSWSLGLALDIEDYGPGEMLLLAK